MTSMTLSTSPAVVASRRATTPPLSHGTIRVARPASGGPSASSRRSGTCTRGLSTSRMTRGRLTQWEACPHRGDRSRSFVDLAQADQLPLSPIPGVSRITTEPGPGGTRFDVVRECRHVGPRRVVRHGSRSVSSEVATSPGRGMTAVERSLGADKPAACSANV